MTSVQSAMSGALMRTALERHIAAERNRDIDAIMASLSPDPFYIIPGYELRGTVAVRAMYEAAMPMLTTENADEYLRALDDPAVTSWGDAHVVLEYTEDYPLHHGMIVVAHRDGTRIRSEHTYFTTIAHPSATAELPLAGVPGVSPIRLGRVTA